MWTLIWDIFTPFLLFSVFTELDFPQVACGVTNKQDQIVNIDMGDENDDLAVAEYVDDIYKFYKLTEVLSSLIKSLILI